MHGNVIFIKPLVAAPVQTRIVAIFGINITITIAVPTTMKQSITCFKVLSFFSWGQNIPNKPSFAGIDINGIAVSKYTAIAKVAMDKAISF